VLEDFDVLSLVDHRMRWYAGDEEALSETLASVASRYEHKLFIGASMGGFGAILHAGRLAREGAFGSTDAVVALGPQCMLSTANLRPPASDVHALDELTARMKESARVAGERGAIVEIHCAADEHFGHALAVPLRDLALTVHALMPRGPFAKLLDRSGMLTPILSDALARILSKHRDLTPLPRADADPHEARATVARWTSVGGQLERYSTDRVALLRLLFGPKAAIPRPGDWFCWQCGVRNMSTKFWCYRCGDGPTGATMVDVGNTRVPNGLTFPWAGDWGCGKCGMALNGYDKACTRCGTGKHSHAGNIIVCVTSLNGINILFHFTS